MTIINNLKHLYDLTNMLVLSFIIFNINIVMNILRGLPIDLWLSAVESNLNNLIRSILIILIFVLATSFFSFL